MTPEEAAEDLRQRLCLYRDAKTATAWLRVRLERRGPVWFANTGRHLPRSAQTRMPI